MALQDRLSLYRSIEEIRQRPLVVYATSSRQNAKGNMAADVIPQLLDQINTISPGNEAIDLLVVGLARSDGAED